MAKEQKVFGAEVKDAPQKKDDKELKKEDGVYEVQETSAQDLMEKLIFASIFIHQNKIVK